MNYTTRLAAVWLAMALNSWAAETVLRVEGAAGRDGVAKPVLTLSMEDLASMPRVSVSAPGPEGKERVFTGVLLSEILKRAGQPSGPELRGSLLSRCVLATAHDGYRVLFSMPELDPAFNANQAMVADHVNGELLAMKDGPLRIVIPGEKREARWVRMLEKIEIVSAPEPMR